MCIQGCSGSPTEGLEKLVLNSKEVPCLELPVVHFGRLGCDYSEQARRSPLSLGTIKTRSRSFRAGFESREHHSSNLHTYWSQVTGRAMVETGQRLVDYPKTSPLAIHFRTSLKR